jgi:hypothetical protein
MLKHYI